MLDQLVESKDNSKQNVFRNGLLMAVMILVITGFVSGLGVSLWNSPLFVGGDGLELSTLVAPPIPDEAPPEPEPEKDEPKKQEQSDAKIATRTEAIARLDMSPTVPPKISTQQFNKRTVPNTPWQLGKENVDVAPGAGTGTPRSGGGGGGFVDPDPPRQSDPDPPKAAPPPPPPPPPPAVPKRISKGVINGSAVSLPVPPYPPAARAVNAKGSVSVAVVISNSGSVISANATSGHPLLRQAAESAARRARFRPTLLSGQAVEVSGVIVYNFQ